MKIRIFTDIAKEQIWTLDTDTLVIELSSKRNGDSLGSEKLIEVIEKANKFDFIAGIVKGVE